MYRFILLLPRVEGAYFLWEIRSTNDDSCVIHGSAKTRQEALDDLRVRFWGYCFRRIDEMCECGARSTYRSTAFEVGHSYWCPVSIFALESK